MMVYCDTLCCAGICFGDHVKCATCRLGKLNVVLDLDETLIHAEHKYVNCDKETPFCQFENYNIFKRPHLDVFLQTVFTTYDVYIWTAAYKSYAKFILKHLLKTTSNSSAHPNQKGYNVR